MTDSDTVLDKPHLQPHQRAGLLDYLRLFRLPNVFTAVADIFMGFIFAGGLATGVAIGSQIGALVALVAASALMYTAGMVLNDVYDVAVDSEQRPERPLPSGRIGIGWATFLGYWMLLTGVAAAAIAGFMYPGIEAIGRESIAWRSGAIAVLLAASVVAYDGVLKKTFVAPVAMGACRFFNVLLGMSAGAAWTAQPLWLLHYELAEIAVAGGIGVYIVGVTWFARTEAKVSNRLHLTGAVLVMLCGFGLLIWYPNLPGGEKLPPDSGFSFWWPVLIMLLGLTLFRRAATAVMDPKPAKVQATIKQCIFSLIMLDAAVCLSTGSIAWALATLALLVPMFLLGRWVYST